MSLSNHFSSAIALFVILYACGSTTQPESRCPPASGEFPPVACARVTGVARDQLGVVLPNMGLRVDSLIPGRGYHYASAAFATDESGRFSMLIYRVNELAPLHEPDTASIEVKLHVSQTPMPRDIPFSRTLVRMNFAPLGEPVTLIPTSISRLHAGLSV
jgi:hypothetical protein